jgi:hypothetical protein
VSRHDLVLQLRPSRETVVGHKGPSAEDPTRRRMGFYFSFNYYLDIVILLFLIG